jgi:hypothetical protein
VIPLWLALLCIAMAIAAVTPTVVDVVRNVRAMRREDRLVELLEPYNADEEAA